MDGQREKSIPAHKHSLRGYNNDILVKNKIVFWLICCLTSVVKSWAYVMAVSYSTTLFLGKCPKTVYQYLVPILSPVNDDIVSLYFDFL